MKRLGMIVVLLLLMGVTAACGRRLPDTPIATTNTTPTEAPTEVIASESEAESAVTAEVTAEATTEADTPDAETEADSIGNVENGAALFASMTTGNSPCSTCHYVDSDQMLVGPGMLGLGERAASTVPGQDAEAYLRNSIIHPNDHVVEGYPAQVMPQNYESTFTEEQLNDLIAYMLSL